MSRNLNRIELFNFKGLATKQSAELTGDDQLRVAINTDLFTRYGAVTKPPGMSRILDSVYTEDGVAKSIDWVGFYKATDLNGQTLRHTLVAAGTKIHRIDSGSLTALTGTGFNITEPRTAGLVHSSAKFDDLLLITNRDPDLIGRGDTLVKYDGEAITRWGVLAPGTLETIVQSFDDSSVFTTSGVTVSDDSTTTIDGNATRVDKTSTSQVNGDIEATVSAFSWDVTIPDRGAVSIYIPRGVLPKLSQGTTKAVEVWVGEDLTTTYYKFEFDRGDLTEGWNLLTLNPYNLLNNVADSALDEDDPKVSITGSPDGTGLVALRFRINTLTAATTVSGIRWDRFRVFDKGTATAAESLADATTCPFASGAEYTYRFTYVTRYGHESNAGPPTRIIKTTAARDEINLTDIPVSSDDQVIARRIYRTVNGGVLHTFLDVINNNTTTTYTDTTADTGLADTSAPLVGDVNDDNSPPSPCGIVKKWKRTIFLAGFPDRPEVVGYSEDDEPESYPTLNEVRLDSKITAMYETYSGFVIETELGKWQVTGDNPDFRFDKVIANIGCVGRRAAGEARIGGWAVDREGMRLYDLNNPIKISEVIRDKFDNDFNKPNIELMQTLHSKSRNAILMFVADGSGNYTSQNFLYQYPLDQLAAGWWWNLSLPSSVDPRDLAEIEDENGTFRLYMGAGDGMVYELFDSSSKNWVNAAGTAEAITTQLQTKYIRAGQVQNQTGMYSGRAAPRLIELRWVGDANATWTVKVDTANGPEQATPTATETLTFNFATAGEQLLRLPVPAMQPGEYVRFTVTNADLNIAGSITGMACLYFVQPGDFPIQSGDLR